MHQTNGLCNIENILVSTICREFESEAPAAEEVLDRVVCSSKQFSFQMCLEHGDGNETFCNWAQRVVGKATI